GLVTPLSGVRFDPTRLRRLIVSLIVLVSHVIPSPLLLPTLCALALLIVTGLVLRARLRQTAIYSMRLVEQRTTPLAARTCLTLLAIAPAPVLPAQSTSATRAIRTHVTVEQQPQAANGMVERLAPRTALAISARSLLSALIDTFERFRLQWSLHATLDQQLRQTLTQLVAAYRQHHLASGAFFVARRRGYLQPRRFPVRWARRVRRSHDLLNVRELAALWHLPQGETETPLLERGRARTLLAPVVPLAHGYRLGVSTQADLRTPVRLPQEALRHNTLLVAKTGKGKSSLLLHLALAQLGAQGAQEGQGEQEGQGIPEGHGQDVGVPVHVGAAPLLPQGELRRRRHATDGGLIVIDPHGDLVSSLLTLVPPARRDDVILVDLADTAYPVALNPLDTLLGRDRDKGVEALLGILSQIWAKFWGPRMQNALEYALKTLYEANEGLVAADPQAGPDAQFTLLDVAPILSSPGFRRDVLSLIHDQALRTWWTHYYKPLDPRLQLEIINPVLTKMAAFSGSRVARRIVGQGRSTLDLTEIVRDGRTLLVNTAKGVVGAETATLVGATLLGALQVALQEQARLTPEERQRFLVVIDEFQSILGVDYAAMLSELRKFGGSFALATQALAHLDALDPTLRPTVLANVDNLFAFATSAEDGRTLARELDDAVTVSDLINLDDFCCYAKVTLDGRRLPVFSLALDRPPTGDTETERVLRRRARARYAHPIDVVEEALTAAAARYLPAHEVYRPEDATGTAFVAASGSVGATRVATPDVVPTPDDGHNDGQTDQRAHESEAPTTDSAGDTSGDQPAGEHKAPRATRRGRYGYRVGAPNAGPLLDRLSDGLLTDAADVWTGLDVMTRRGDGVPPAADPASSKQRVTSESAGAQDAVDDHADNISQEEKPQ
ncbi:MAG TPA: type IV secretory system conjugative DNA transfer family protein, partial [Ktedonobacterales bacterium]|nr:type IV secretory system conjugative DNA transfer family protein [Ktedonobacterales bacterium]